LADLHEEGKTTPGNTSLSFFQLKPRELHAAGMLAEVKVASEASKKRIAERRFIPKNKSWLLPASHPSAKMRAFKTSWRAYLN
jgi:hypothetical protein